MNDFHLPSEDGFFVSENETEKEKVMNKYRDNSDSWIWNSRYIIGVIDGNEDERIRKGVRPDRTYQERNERIEEMIKQVEKDNQDTFDEWKEEGGEDFMIDLTRHQIETLW